MLDEILRLLGGVALALGFALLTRRTLDGMLRGVRAQSATVFLAAAIQAWASGSAVQAGLGVCALVGGVGLVWGMRRQPPEAPIAAPPRAPIWAAAAAMTGLAVVAVMPISQSGLPRLREHLALALATVLVALLVLPTRRAAPAQLAGLLALGNGVALAAVALGGLLSWPMALAVIGLYAIAAAGLAALPAGEAA